MTLRIFRVWVYLLAFAGTSAFAAAGDEFYDRLYGRGIAQFNEGNYVSAYSSLRLAAFGLLEDVKRFETAQIYMTVAATRMKREGDARAAAQRVVAAERVEHRYTSLSLPDAVRKEFDDAARTLLTADQLAVLRGGGAAAARPQPQPQSQPQPPAPVVVPPPQPKPAQPQPQPQPPPQARAQPQPAPQPQAASSTNTAPSFADAERAVNSGDLAKARTLYRAIVDAPQLSHTAALRAAEGLYRSRDFAGAIRAFERAGAIAKGEEQYHWYYAVALYENGLRRDAKRELRAALPFIELTPEVEHYRALIEGAAD